MSGKLILMGNGKVVFIPPRPITESVAAAIRESFARFGNDPARIVAIMGETVEVIDNRPKERADVVEVTLADSSDEVGE